MKETYLMRLPSETKRWLENDAKERGLSLNGLIMAILSEYKRQTDKGQQYELKVK